MLATAFIVTWGVKRIWFWTQKSIWFVEVVKYKWKSWRGISKRREETLFFCGFLYRSHSPNLRKFGATWGGESGQKREKGQTGALKFREQKDGQKLMVHIEGAEENVLEEQQGGEQSQMRLSQGRGNLVWRNRGS